MRVLMAGFCVLMAARVSATAEWASIAERLAKSVVYIETKSGSARRAPGAFVYRVSNSEVLSRDARSVCGNRASLMSSLLSTRPA